MTLYEFNALDEKEKGEAIFTQATFIDNRNDAPYKVQLYRLSNFYVEVYYDAQANAIVRYRSFSRLGQLAPYLKS